ncbi:hypothetical protein CSV75_04290 [Sporosarcina sp. P18a]|uniref:type II secretion system protein n=1 Tax=Sporosarcina sp. P18a TaxID=2048259 RepID=UPI000C16FFB7|nr:type II secretion system protein [Sporosarcina sp. P18a]PIC81005.1 hypothetical protein CSV75_04290 [Sporosarcina sp. P18a]
MPETKRIFNNQYGFTFLELMLVLSIMMILTAVILPFSEKHLKKESEEDALKQFIAAVYEAQLYAMTHKGSVALTFSDSGATYKVERMDRTVTLRSGIFPDGMRMTKQSPLKRLDFAETGYMVKTGKMYFSTQSRGLIFISFQFERGRMIVNE